MKEAKLLQFPRAAVLRSQVRRARVGRPVVTLDQLEVEQVVGIGAFAPLSAGRHGRGEQARRDLRRHRAATEGWGRVALRRRLLLVLAVRCAAACFPRTAAPTATTAPSPTTATAAAAVATGIAASFPPVSHCLSLLGIAALPAALVLGCCWWLGSLAVRCCLSWADVTGHKLRRVRVRRERWGRHGHHRCRRCPSRCLSGTPGLSVSRTLSSCGSCLWLCRACHSDLG